MQRLNPTHIPSLNNPFTVNYKFNGKDVPYYRFILNPRNPSANYAVRNGILTFENTNTFLHMNDIGVSVKSSVTNKFNVQASLATNFKNMLHITDHRTNKNAAVYDASYLVVDFPKAYVDERSELMSNNYGSMTINQDFIPAGEGHYISDFLTTGISYSIPKAKATYPVYHQTITTETTASTYGSVSSNVQSHEKKIPNPLIKSNGQSFMQVLNYDKDDQLNFGSDVVVSDHANLNTVAYRRKKDANYDWCSHLQPKMNRESYLKLTASLDNVTIDAQHVAKLFDDYANKGSGFSALIHFHMFRHTANIHMARVIAKELKAQSFENANPLDIADFLATKYQELKSKHPINAEGSFARRINYCLLQLTGGMCHNVDTFLNFKEQFALKNECANKLSN